MRISSTSPCRVAAGDVGGTSIRGAYWDGHELSPVRHELTCVTDADELVEQVVGLLAAHLPADRAAVVVPGTVSDGLVTWANGPFDRFPLGDELSHRLGIPVEVENDVNGHLRAELHARPPVHSAVMLAPGTGLGGAIAIGGRIHSGFTGAAAELGHTIVGAESYEIPAKPANAAHPASLEALASGTTFELLGHGSGFLHAEAVVAAAREGDEHALGAIAVYVRWLGVGVANAIHALDPELIIIGGQLFAKASDLMMAPLEAEVRRLMLAGAGTKTHIEPPAHGEYAGVLGAALLAEAAATERR